MTCYEEESESIRFMAIVDADSIRQSNVDCMPVD